MRGLIFTEHSIRGLESGSKTMTRRLAGERAKPLYRVGEALYVKEAWAHAADSVETCRAAHADAMMTSWVGPYYRAAESMPDSLNWLTPLFMPQWAARFRIEITAVKREQLQDITAQDADAEGIIELDGVLDVAELSRVAKSMGCPAEDSRAWFAVVWDMIHKDDRTKVWLEVGDPGYTLDRPWKTVCDGSTLWAANPTVDAYTFRLVKP